MGHVENDPFPCIKSLFRVVQDSSCICGWSRAIIGLTRIGGILRLSESQWASLHPSHFEWQVYLIFWWEGTPQKII